MAGGLAKQGMIPVVALYSTFLQRAYDMILQDVCMLGLHVIFAVDRAGLVGEDGETHHGIYDIGFLSQFPGMRILCPASLEELQDMLTWAVQEQDGPVAIRYPKGGNVFAIDSAWNNTAVLEKSSVVRHRQGDDVTILTYGNLINNAMRAAELLAEGGINATVLRLTVVAPLPISEILEKVPKNSQVFVLEDMCTGSGIRERLAWELSRFNNRIYVDGIDLGHNFVTHGSVDVLHQHYGLDADSIANYIKEVYQYEE